jgi:tetratricopeptide (TPR) repeat protein
MSPLDAISGFLRALGTAGQDIAADAAERAAQYRSRLAGRRLLLLLDNARSAEQVRPLLPGAPGSVVVVTSRDSLAGLVARDGVWRLELDTLAGTEARSLLRALIGPRADAEPDMLEALAAQCSGLPLALRIAAELVVSRPGSSLADLVTELTDQTRRLELLSAAGDEQSAVRTVFSWSYRNLDPHDARTFRYIGLHPGADFNLSGVAALTARTADQARASLEVLARAHLVRAVSADRYDMHDLLREYAAELAASQESLADRDAAMTALFDYYLHSAEAAVQFLIPASESGVFAGAAADSDAARFADSPAARAWLDAERATLVAIAAHTADHGWPQHTPRLAASLFRYLEGGGHYAETTAICECARRAAHRSGDRVAEAEACNNGTVVDLRQGRYPEAAHKLGLALDLYRQVGDHVGQARVLRNLGIVTMLQGDYQQARDYQQQALDLYTQAGNQVGEMRTLMNVGSIDLRQGRYDQAVGRLRRGLDLCRQLGGQTIGGYLLANLGIVGLRQGEDQQAVDHLEQALAIFREIGDPTGEALALSGLGVADRRQGRYQRAGQRHEQALALCREHGDQPGEAEALNSIGELLLATGEPDRARTQHEAALALADHIGDKYELARAHNGVADACIAAGNRANALSHWQRAHGLYTDLGAPEASQIRVKLAAIPDDEAVRSTVGTP